MSEECRRQVYSEDYLDYIMEYFPLDLTIGNLGDSCYAVASNHLAILYEEGREYKEGPSYYVKMIPRCYGLLSSDQVLESAGVYQVRRQQGLELFGQGVMVGFVDTGIDYSHPAFIREDGRTRILGIWDQTMEELREGEQSPEGFSYGAEYTEEDINRALASDTPLAIVPSTDENGHGTSLAGIACGNMIEEQEFSGVAPLSSICVVKCKEAKQNLRDYYCIDTEEPCFAENDIMLGIRYLWQQAAKFQMPLVICLGMGTNQGGHNRGGALGELLEDYGDYRGILLVVAAGNEANLSHHYKNDDLGSVDNVEVELRVGGNDTGFTIDLWTDATDIYSVGLISPDGEYSGKVQARLGEAKRVTFLFAGTVVTIEYLLFSYENGEECIRMRFQNVISGIWKIRIFNEFNQSRRFDMWLPMERFISEQTYFLRANPDTTICDPANNTGVITSAYYNSLERSVVAESSRGYTRQEQIKPDFAAPGVNVYGPEHFLGTYPVNAEEREIRARYGYRTGSSQGAAITAGATALLAEWAYIRENDLGMDTRKAKMYLIRGAERNGFTVPSRQWGNGLLDIYGVFDRIRPRG